MFPALATFISGTVNESLKKLVQPSGLIAASIFTLLNVLLVFPLLAGYSVTFVTHFFGLQDVWQTLALVALVLMLGYLLVSLNTFILNLMSGELWRNTFFGAFFIQRAHWWQKKLKTQSRGAGGPLTSKSEAEQRRALLTLTTDYPPYEYEGVLSPTILGNVLNAVSTHIWAHYRIDMATLWPHLEVIISEEKTLPARIQDAKGSLDFLLNLSFLLYLFAFEYALASIWTHSHVELFAPAFLLAGYLIYRASISQAHAWGDAVQMAFDLYRGKLREKLGLPEAKTRAEEFAMWENASRWLQWNTLTGPDPFLPKEPHPTESEDVPYVVSDNAKVQIRRIITTPRIPANGSAAPIVERWRYADYLILVSHNGSEHAAVQGSVSSREACNCPARGIYVVVSDPKVPSIKENPALLNLSEWSGTAVTNYTLPSGKKAYAHDLVWRIAELPWNGSGALRYRLSDLLFRTSVSVPNLAVLETIPEEAGSENAYQLTLTNIGAERINEVTVEVFDVHNQDASSLQGTRTVAEDAQQQIDLGSPARAEQGYHNWHLTGLALGHGQSVILDCFPA